MMSNEPKKPSNVRAAEAAFEAELEHFRMQAEGVVQFLATYLTIHMTAAHNAAVHRMLNGSALYWSTVLGALQQSAFITLGRIFDQGSEHNIDRLIGLAQARPSLFSRDALRSRKRASGLTDPEKLDGFMATTYEPSADDFRTVRVKIAHRREVYERNYHPLRNQHFAHSETIDRSEVDALFAQTNVGELQELLDFACALHGALWGLYFNGTRPTLRLSKDGTSPQMRNLHDQVGLETEALLCKLAGVKPGFDSEPGAHDE